MPVGSDAGTRIESRPRRMRDRPTTRDAGSTGFVLDERRLALRLLLVVGAGYFAAQFLLMPLQRPVGWDEAVYLSQVSPRVDATHFDVWHSRGITLLVAPVMTLGGSVPDVRLFLMLLSAAVMTLVFTLWIPVVGLAAPIGAYLFSFTWLSLYGGSVVMPNLWAAMLGVGVAACLVRRLQGETMPYVLLGVAMLCAMALFRPTEATVLACVLGLYALHVRRTSWRLVLGLSLGLALGWLPWIVEMSARFGGLWEALSAANSRGHLRVGPVTDHLLAYLRSTHGSADPDVGLPMAGLLWWGLLVVVAAIGLRRRSDAPRSIALLCSVAALALALEYIVLVSFVASRFLLPAYAFAALAAAIGLRSLFRDGVPARVVGVAVLVAIVPWAVWQGAVASRVEAANSRVGRRLVAVGLLLHDLADGRRCSFVSPGAYPQIQLASGCTGGPLTSPPRPTRAQWLAVDGGEEVFLILTSVVRGDSPLAHLSPIRVESAERPWFIYRLSEAGR